MQVALWSVSAAAVVIAGLAAFADRRRTGRSDPDAVGFMPWPLILILAILIGAVCAAMALRG